MELEDKILEQIRVLDSKIKMIQSYTHSNKELMPLRVKKRELQNQLRGQNNKYVKTYNTGRD